MNINDIEKKLIVLEKRYEELNHLMAQPETALAIPCSCSGMAANTRAWPTWCRRISPGKIRARRQLAETEQLLAENTDDEMRARWRRTS